MLNRLRPNLWVLFCLLSLGAKITGDTPSYDPIPIRLKAGVSFLVTNRFAQFTATSLVDPGPVPGFATNFITLKDLDLKRGDKVRLKTTGGYAIGVKDADGNIQFPNPPQAQSQLGLFTAGFAPIPDLPPDLINVVGSGQPSDLPPYATVPFVSPDGTDPTDIPDDFIITTDGVITTIPYHALYLAVGDTDPNEVASDVNHDFGIELLPLEKVRFSGALMMGAETVTVGDLITGTVVVTNLGNVTARQMTSALVQVGGTPAQVQLVTGPPPNGGSLPAGEVLTFQFSYRALLTGTVRFSVTIDRFIKGGNAGGVVLLGSVVTLVPPVVDPLITQVSAAPALVDVGKPIEVVVTAINHSTDPLADVGINGALVASGPGQVVLESGPDPAMIPELAPGQSAYFTNRYSAVSAGLVTFTGSVQATGPKGTVAGTTAASPGVLIVSTVQIPTTISLHRLDALGLTPDSINAGLTDIDAPLALVTDTAALDGEPEVSGGLVADGVTPLLIRFQVDPNDLAPFPAGRHFTAALGVDGGGTLDGTQPTDSLQVLDVGTGSWSLNQGFRLTASQPTAYLWVAGIASLNLRLNPGETELRVSLKVTDDDAQGPAGTRTFAIRRPPVALIHDSNSAGDWGASFVGVLGTSRPVGPENDPDNFVRLIRYGQDVDTLISPLGSSGLVNTTWPLANCAFLALEAFDAGMASVTDRWAMTRYDVVAHGQGGVLTRMLCNANSNPVIDQPFRNPSNFNRGRFHRVVTVGTPHNGSRLLRYLLDLSVAGKTPSLPPGLASTLLANQKIALQKLDPLGPQLTSVNDPSELSPWYPDAAARFHLVRTVIDGGLAPAPLDPTFAYAALGLTISDAGAGVLPRGSDGLVDYDSMAASLPPSEVGGNVFSLPATSAISHAGTLPAFGSTGVQTASAEVADPVIQALDQEDGFEAFTLAPPLPETEADQIDTRAAGANITVLPGLIQISTATGPNRGGVAKPLGAPEGVYQFELAFPQDFPPQGQVLWTVEVLGPGGIATDGVTIAPYGDNDRHVRVTLAKDLRGDVVLAAVYVSGEDQVVSAVPFLVANLPPPGVDLGAIRILPGSITLPLGATVPVQLFADYDDGTSSLRYLDPGAVTATSSQPDVVSVDDPLRWQLLSVGTAQIVFNWSGYQTTSEITVFDPDAVQEPPALTVTDVGNGGLTLGWPGYVTGFILEVSTDPAVDGSWHPVKASPPNFAGHYSFRVPTGLGDGYYRLRRGR